MPPKSKQADRNAQRRAAKKTDDEEPAPGPAGDVGVAEFLELGKALVMGSCLAKFAPKMPDLLKPPGEGPAAAENQEIEKKPGEETEEKTNGEEKTNCEASGETAEPVDASGIFAALIVRLAAWNCLGLGFPESGEDAKAKWLALKDLELDWGPRKSRKGTPSLTRIVTNVYVNMPQYIHILLALMLLRSFLFRSYFAFLPWLTGLQMASLMVPVETLPQVPMKFRAAGTLGIHSLVWFFFLYEVVIRTYFLEKFLIVGLFAFHAHSVRPTDA
jgi:hypothetical protein